jgi:hypothetical protein
MSEFEPQLSAVKSSDVHPIQVSIILTNIVADYVTATVSGIQLSDIDTRDHDCSVSTRR